MKYLILVNKLFKFCVFKKELPRSNIRITKCGSNFLGLEDRLHEISHQLAPL